MNAAKGYMSDNGGFSFPKEHGHSDEDAEEYQKIAKKAHENLTSTGETEVNHEGVLEKHKKIYESDNVEEHSGEELGHAAAFEALKKVCTGGSYDKSELLSLAMSEGMKLWQKKQSYGGGDGGGGKEEILSGAASMAMKLMNKGDSGSGGLASLASTYFK
ncbi:14201_t:CDS:2 [Dentiscutata erythropus]|uniref:14201_t:CDS:1 n=1 Tax=Dentiscutata erythropus TaxID=1348616 RepID=A0A9N9DJN4_9GLOM|nr:14201_t:CDS:2 [Dentiscutata erythropus]